MKDSDPKVDYTKVPETPLPIDVATVLQVIQAIYKNPTKAKAAMSVHELKALADAARGAVEKVELSAKPNGITDNMRINALLEIDATKLRQEVQHLQERTEELEKKLAAYEGR